MRFRSVLARLRLIISIKVGVLCKKLEHIPQVLCDFLAKQQRRHHGFQCCMGVGLADAVHGAQVGMVVSHDFGGDILDHCLLRQARDMFKVETVLEPFERFLNAPALVVKVANAGG